VSKIDRGIGEIHHSIMYLRGEYPGEDPGWDDDYSRLGSPAASGERSVFDDVDQ